MVKNSSSFVCFLSTRGKRGGGLLLSAFAVRMACLLLDDDVLMIKVIEGL